MNDHHSLLDIWETPEQPSDHARSRAMALLRERTGRTEMVPERRSTGIRLSVVGAAVLALVLGITFLPDLAGINSPGPTEAVRQPLGPAANASEALERAADAAEDREFVAPRPDQWIYQKHENISPAEGPGGFATGGPLGTVTDERWTRADGKRAAAFGEDGKLRVFRSSGGAVMSGDGFEYEYEEGMPDPIVDDNTAAEAGFPPGDYTTLASLPTDPDALTEWVLARVGPMDEVSGEQRDALAYQQLVTLMRYSYLPPKLEAAIFRALEQIPGATLAPDAVDVAGRPAIAVGRVIEGWLHSEVLLDPQTYEYLGERTIAVQDKVLGDWEVKNGTVQLFTARIDSGVVDRPGERPTPR